MCARFQLVNVSYMHYDTVILGGCLAVVLTAYLVVVKLRV